MDASVAAKWFFPEALSDRARELLRSGGELLAPELLLLEVGNVAWKKALRGEISTEHAQAVASALPQMFSLLVPASQVQESALELALRLRHPVYDCAYLVLAQARDLPLVTADSHLLERLGGGEWPGRAVHLRDT